VYSLITAGFDVERAEPDLDGHLRWIAGECAQVLGQPGVALLLGDEDGRPSPGGASGQEVERLVDLEIGAGQGPSLRCLATGADVRVLDLEFCDERWQAWSAAAVRAGYGSTLSVPLVGRGRRYGAITVFMRSLGFPDIGLLRLVPAVADSVAIGLHHCGVRHRHAVQVEHLQRALSSRVPIEQAKGILAERRGCSVEEAFELLRSAARRSSRRLHDVAREVVEGKAGPPLGGARPDEA
jgi:hypothetical protein